MILNLNFISIIKKLDFIGYENKAYKTLLTNKLHLDNTLLT